MSADNEDVLTDPDVDKDCFRETFEMSCSTLLKTLEGDKNQDING